ncbi:SDR family oxidoreductase [Streptomyces sp. NPDC023838]|uniref:SDR family oxidoreductase n=1 Tax=Streptomyces sp. NPDC023838 TaxID=3154325 RepID=UPI0033E27394
MILVTGATGTVGGEVARLLAAGHPLRILARRPERVAVTGPAVEVVGGEYADRDSLDRALKGVRAAFLVTGSIGEPDDVRFVEAARDAGVRHLVKLSAMAVTDPAADDLITRRQRENEEAVRESGLAWTLLRPRAFMTNTLSWARSVREEGVVRALYGDAPNATVDPRDIAEVAARALTEPGVHEGRAYALSGPAALTPAEQTALLGDALGRPLRFEELAPERARAALLARYPQPVAEALLHSAERQRAGAKAGVSGAVEELTGHPARSYAEWARDHAQAFA